MGPMHNEIVKGLIIKIETIENIHQMGAIQKPLHPRSFSHKILISISMNKSKLYIGFKNPVNET
jgi:hypothetical protein